MAGICAVLATACAAAVIAGYASGPRPQGPSELTLHPERQEEIIAGRRAREFQKKLGLTEEQTQQAQERLMALRNDLRGLRKTHQGDFASFRSAAQARIEQFTNAMRASLSEEQRAQFDALKGDRVERLEALRNLMGQ